MDAHIDLLLGFGVALGSLVLCGGAFVVVIARHGRRLERHERWQRVMELRVGNLHEDRRRAHVRSLQMVAKHTARPPSLSGAKTVEIDEELLMTQRLACKDEGDEGEKEEG